MTSVHIELLDVPECSDEQSSTLSPDTTQTPLWRSECTILSTLMLLSHQCHTLSGLPRRRSDFPSQAAEKPVSPVWGSCLHLSLSSHSPSHVWCWSEGSESVCTFEWESWESLHSLLDSTSSLKQWLRSSKTLGCGTWCRGSLKTSGVRWSCWPNSDHWFSSWSIPASVAHWSPVPLSLDGHSQRGWDQLLLVWRWSRWEQREADSHNEVHQQHVHWGWFTYITKPHSALKIQRQTTLIQTIKDEQHFIFTAGNIQFFCFSEKNVKKV